MQQITDYIPKTSAECRSLLKTLGENRDGLSLANRYGHKENLNADDVKTLIELIENQIGEKAPEVKPKEQGKKAKPAKKNNSTQTKK